MIITATTRKSPEAIVRVAHVLTRQNAHIEKITINPEEREQVMEITIKPHTNINHITKQIGKLYDVTNVSYKDTLHDLTLS